MSRITNMDDWDDEDGPLRQGRWERNTETTIKGKRGQKVLRQLEAALVALPLPELTDELFWREPSDMERDIADAYGVVAAPQVCVLGAYARHIGVDYQKAEWLNEESVSEVAPWAADELGMAYTLAWNLMFENDEAWAYATPRRRYDGILKWVRQNLSTPIANEEER